MERTFTYQGKEITLLGTAHISQQSIEEVTSILLEKKPDTVCVELCESRFESIKNKDRWKEMDIVKVIKEGKAPLLMANLMLSAFQKKMGDQLGVQPGAEMVEAIRVADEIGAHTQLCDRSVTITLKRAWGLLGLWEKVKLISQLFGSLFENPEISEDEIEKLKETDVLNEAIHSMSEEMPIIKEVLIDERDQYMAQKIKEAKGTKIVAVLGAGHLPGIERHILEDTAIDMDAITEIPPPSIWTAFMKWGLPAAILGMIIYGFTFMSGDVSFEMIKRWVLANGIMAAIGAMLAGGHILTIIVAFIAAPITSLNPTIAAGWVSGLTEAWVRKPKVEDFENLSTDITSFKGFRKNEITRILMVVVFSNIGSAIGTFAGIPLITALL